MQIKVSIIITTKNSALTLENLLQSIKNQTFKNREIILVDNNSLDDTLRIAKKYTKNIYTKGPERSAQRNFGAQKAKGEYLLFLDADMELKRNVIKECVKITDSFKAIVIPEKTVGRGLLQDIRRFEREMYEGDLSVELARFYDKKVFEKAGGFDEKLTGPEDYDLFYRVNKKYPVGRIKSYILHHEEGLTLPKLLQKKFYYANMGAGYAEKHPELIKTQGTIFFRKTYLKHWKKFIKNPVVGFCFLFTRILETIFAVSGYISAVGFIKFIKKLLNLI